MTFSPTSSRKLHIESCYCAIWNLTIWIKIAKTPPEKKSFSGLLIHVLFGCTVLIPVFCYYGIIFHYTDVWNTEKKRMASSGLFRDDYQMRALIFQYRRCIWFINVSKTELPKTYVTHRPSTALKVCKALKLWGSKFSNASLSLSRNYLVYHFTG